MTTLIKDLNRILPSGVKSSDNRSQQNSALRNQEILPQDKQNLCQKLCKMSWEEANREVAVLYDAGLGFINEAKALSHNMKTAVKRAVYKELGINEWEVPF